MEFQYKPAGDLSILIKISNDINTEVNIKVTELANIVERKANLGFGEVILGYNTLLINYNPKKMTYQDAVSNLKSFESKIKNKESRSYRIIEIPTIYGGKWGQDLEDVAEHNGLDSKEVISIHTSKPYLVYFIGFTPGFPFLGGMSKHIATPRLSSPRVSIPAGSVGIANNQTGLYPVASPGGWRLIGRTPLDMFDPMNEKNPTLLIPGDYVRFKPINEEEYYKIKKSVEEGTYGPVIERKK